jgi:cytosine/adenosine deaminase-related metal-dependent hydrolase
VRIRIETDDSAVVVVAGRIADGATDACDVTISVPGGTLLPGLINAHDHLHRNHYPRLGRPPYPDAYAWGRDIHQHDTAAIERARALPLRTALLFGAFRNVIGGVTTVVHHDRWEPDFDDDFPVRVPRVRCAHSLGFDSAAVTALAGSLRAAEPFAIHVAEGISAEAAAEIDALGAHGLLRSGLLAVHAVAVDAFGAQHLRQANAAIVWCPTSNIFLFGATCSRATLDSVDVLLGTDALLTGDGTMLDELRAARRLHLMSDERLMQAVGSSAAKRLGIAAASMDIGVPADLVLLRAPLLDAGARDVALVMVGGMPRVADEELGELFAATGVPAVPMEIGGVRKLVLRSLANAADRVISEWPESARIVAPQGAHAR